MAVFCVVETNIGFIGLVAEDGALTHSSLPKDTREDAFEAIREGLSGEVVEDEAGFGKLPELLRRYATGNRVDFSGVRVDLSGYGPFHKSVLMACQRIGHGEIVTYRDLARLAGSEKAARAAGTAMATNRIPLIIPCHRVLASGGRIGGFSSGLEWKRKLLRLEGVDI